MSSGKPAFNAGHERLHLNLAKLKSHGHKFEIVVHPDQAIAFKQGAAIDIKDILYAEKIFFDAQKGLVAGETELMAALGTKDTLKAAAEIIKNGEIQLTAEYRDKLREEKYNKIVYLIRRNAIDPRTSLPHPEQRIRLAMDEAKVKIDEFRNADDQVQDVVKEIRTVLPLKFEIIELEVIISPQYAPKSFHALKSFGKILKETWQNDGSLKCHVEMPAGLQQEFYDAINKVTHGSVQSKVVGSR
ncbi:MAG: ribosome assembly factor SBDS [Nanoarchaeota archaeon]